MRGLTRSMRSLLLVAGSTLFASSVAAQRVDPNRVFDVTVQANGQVMSATIRDGGMFQLTLNETDEYRLVPVVTANRSTVTMAVYRGTAGQPSTSRVVERVELATGRPATLRTNPRLTLVIDRIRSAPPARQASFPRTISFGASASWRRALQSDNCCVCCGDVCACACGVKMGCGSCCMPGCCTINETSNPDGGEDPARAARFAAFIGGSACERPFAAPAAATRIASR